MHDFSSDRSEPGKVVFIHLTKTAGGTLKEAIMTQEGIQPHFVYSEDDWGRYDEQACNVVYGHPDKWLFGNIGTSLGGRGRFAYVVFLRHPVIRTISHYYHLYNVEPGPVGERIRKFSDINEFFAHGYHWEFENYFCRILSNHKNVLNKDDMELKFSSAMDTLRTKVAFIGFQEYFGYSLHRLNKMFGLSLSPPKSVNLGKYSLSGISDDTLDIIRGMNGYDIELYREMMSDFLREA